MSNYYEILGIDKNASIDEIKKAYRNLTLKYHPDRNPNEDAKDKIRLINEAYETLGDNEKKINYDNQLNGINNNNNYINVNEINELFNMMFSNNGFPGFHQNIRIFHNGKPVNINHDDAFNTFFKNIQKPPPIVKNINLTLEQVYNGCIVSLSIERWVIFNNIRTIENEIININIPRGIENNEFMIINDKGNINENIKGDIKILFNINEHNLYKRVNSVDILLNKSITLKESLCGFSFEIEHLNGKIMNINNIIQPCIVKPKYTKIINNLGLIKNDNTGNLIIEFDVIFPDNLTIEQKNIINNIL